MNVKTLLEMRKERGYAIAQTNKVVHQNGVWVVPSTSKPSQTYKVSFSLEGAKCNCPDFAERGIRCKHIFAVDIVISRKFDKDGTMTITKKITYPQNWTAYNKSQINEQELFMKLLSDLCKDIEEPLYTFGRPRLPLGDMIFSSALKVYSTFSLRRFMCDVKEAQNKGYIDQIPHFSMISYYMAKPELTQILQDLIVTSSLPLKAVESSFSIDSSGFSPSKFSRWFSHKWGKETDRKLWYKLSVVNGNATHTITACEITTAYVNDNMMFSKLVKETHDNFNVKELSADKGYLSDANMVYLDRLGITGYIPFKSSNVAEHNHRQGKRYHSDIWRNSFNYFNMHQSGFLKHYNQRSNIETAFHMIKSKFGDSVRSKNETACVNEILLKVLCHNICVLISEMFELGIKPEFLE